MSRGRLPEPVIGAGGHVFGRDFLTRVRIAA
jgi:hypothetical protein